MIGIINYDSGHVNNLASAVKRAGGDCVLINSNTGEQVDKLIIYADIKVAEFMYFLKDTQLDQLIINSVARKIPILAINNGLHALYDYVETELIEGLHIIPGRIKSLNHILNIDSFTGWSILKSNRELHRKVPLNLLKGINVIQRAMFYFKQTDYIDTDDLKTVFAFTKFTAKENTQVLKKTSNLVPAIINHEKIWGLEFLPEKSERIGIRLLKNFVNYVPPNDAEG